MTASEILKLIEEADPEDTDMLDEIDARGHQFIYGCSPQDRYIVFCPQYTRSRDALKSIRPKGWKLWVSSSGNCEISNPYEEHLTMFGNGETEELAELHAIIQAIAHERNK